ncbi:MAG: hypothetical protein ABDH16_03105 [Thermodesulfovibrionaceae bacterium]
MKKITVCRLCSACCPVEVNVVDVYYPLQGDLHPLRKQYLVRRYLMQKI